MVQAIKSNFRARKNYGTIRKVVDIPNLIDIQKKSYDDFLQKDIEPDDRQLVGLQAVFKDIFPIHGIHETATLDFVSYEIQKPKYDIRECIARGMTYQAPVRVLVRLVIWDIDPDTGAKSLLDLKEKEVFFGEIPLMTDSGTFIINGTERVIVS